MLLTTLLLAGLLDAPVVVSPVVVPSGELISLAQVKKHLKDPPDDDDALIAIYLAAVIATLDGPKGWLGRALQPQTIVQRYDRFDQIPASLPYPPVISVTAVEQLINRVWVAVPFFFGDQLWPAGADWPNTTGSIRVTYRAGMDGQADRVLPFPILAAILLMVGDLYRFRETVVVNARSEPVAMSTTVENLLFPLRLF